MNRSAILFTCLTMTFVSLLFLSEVRNNLNSAKENEKLAQFWKDRVAREQLKKLLVMGQFADFKQDMALLIPGQINKTKVKEEQARLRSLASVIPHEGTHEITLGYTAKELLIKGKNQVSKKEFRDGLKTLKKLISKFPDSLHVVEAHYLIIEAYSQQDKSALVVEWVDKMVELFPANRLTGWALLKVGQLYELDGRHEDAIRIYKIIVSVYDDPKLISQAQVSVKELRL